MVVDKVVFFPWRLRPWAIGKFLFIFLFIFWQAILDGKLRSGSQRGGAGQGSSSSSGGSHGAGKRVHSGEIGAVGSKAGQGAPSGIILKKAGKAGGGGGTGVGGSELVRSNSAPAMASPSLGLAGGRLLLRNSVTSSMQEGVRDRAGSRGGLSMQVARAGDAECLLRHEGMERNPHGLYTSGGGDNDAGSNWGSEVSVEDHEDQGGGGRCASPLFGGVSEQREVAAGVEEGCDTGGDHRKDPLLFDME